MIGQESHTPGNDVEDEHCMVTDECSARLCNNRRNRNALRCADALYSAHNATGIVLHA